MNDLKQHFIDRQIEQSFLHNLKILFIGELNAGQYSLPANKLVYVFFFEWLNYLYNY